MKTTKKHIKGAEKTRKDLKKCFAAGDKCIKGEISFKEFDKIWEKILG